MVGPRERPKEGTTPAVNRPASVAGSHPQPRLFGAGLPPRARTKATPLSAQIEGALSNRVLGGEGQGVLGLELVDEQVAGTQPQCAFRCGLSAPAPLAHFGTAGARQPRIHPGLDVVTCRARRDVQVCVGSRAPRSARSRRTPH